MFRMKVESAVTVSHVLDSCHRILDRFFKEYKLPMPRIKVVNSLTSDWLGRCSYSSRVDKDNTTIEVQKRITEDEKTLDRILTHELIHHYEFLKNPSIKLAHGKEFKAMAEKINSVMGKNYVSVESDQSYVEMLDKDYYLLVMPSYSNKDVFGYAWAINPSSEQKAAISRSASSGAKLYKSRDARFTHGIKIQKYEKFSWPSDKETQAKLKLIYEKGKAIPVEPTQHKEELPPFIKKHLGIA